MAGHRNVNLASLAEVDKLNEPLESLSQRAKQKSAGGPTWAARAARPRKVGPLVNGRIVIGETQIL